MKKFEFHIKQMKRLRFTRPQSRGICLLLYFFLFVLPVLLIPSSGIGESDFDDESIGGSSLEQESYNSADELEDLIGADDPNIEEDDDLEIEIEESDEDIPELDEESDEELEEEDGEEEGIAGLDEQSEEEEDPLANLDEEEEEQGDLALDDDDETPVRENEEDERDVAGLEDKNAPEEEEEEEDAADLLAEAEAEEEDFEEEEEAPETEEQTLDRLAEAEEPPQAEATEEVPQFDSSQPLNIRNLEFKMVEQKSRISITFDGAPRYREISNGSVNQFVYYFENTKISQRLQRAYDTSEFISPVALFTVLQMPKEIPPLTKLIVQLREQKKPDVVVSGRKLNITFPAPDFQPTLAKTESEKDEQAIEKNIYASGQVFTGDAIKRLEIKNSDVQDVLRLIARTSGYNIIIGDDVKGDVGTISLRNVPWDQAFTLVLQTKKLGYIRQGNVLRVGSLESLKAEKEAALANQRSRLKVEPLRTILIPISYATASDLAPRAKRLLTERGSVETDARTNTVIVRDIQSVVSKVQKLMLALDTQPARVSISAKVVEMLTSFTRNFGLSQISVAESFSGVNFDSSLTSVINEVSVTNIAASSFANLNMRFEIGELENKVRTLANPTVSAVNNKKAQVSQSISFLVPDIVVVGGIITQTFKQITANLRLDVTPIVSGDGSISMKVQVTNDIPRGEGSELTIDSRTVDTEVLVENGDTAVIGGIFQNTVNSAKQGIPFLMRIPILGFFFTTSNSYQEIQNEIVVFLTPKILNADKAFKRAI